MSSFKDKIQSVAFENMSSYIYDLVQLEIHNQHNGIPVDYQSLFDCVVEKLEDQHYAVEETLSGRG